MKPITTAKDLISHIASKRKHINNFNEKIKWLRETFKNEKCLTREVIYPILTKNKFKKTTVNLNDFELLIMSLENNNYASIVYCKEFYSIITFKLEPETSYDSMFVNTHGNRNKGKCKFQNNVLDGIKVFDEDYIDMVEFIEQDPSNNILEVADKFFLNTEVNMIIKPTGKSYSVSFEKKHEK